MFDLVSGPAARKLSSLQLYIVALNKKIVFSPSQRGDPP
jgi:hypothetical protein